MTDKRRQDRLAQQRHRSSRRSYVTELEDALAALRELLVADAALGSWGTSDFLAAARARKNAAVESARRLLEAQEQTK